MTTVAYDTNLTIAADSRATDDKDDSIAEMIKIYQIPEGRYIGFAGDAEECWNVVRWLKEGAKGKAPNMAESYFIIVNPNGEVFCSDEKWGPYPVLAPVAIGTGAQGAMVAMRLGKTAREAVALAAREDGKTGGPILSYNVKTGERICE